MHDVHIISINLYLYIYIDTRATPGCFPSVAVYKEGSHSQSNVVATLHSIGKINKGIRKY